MLNAVFSNFVGDTGMFRQKFGSTFSISLPSLLSAAFELKPVTPNLAATSAGVILFSVFDVDVDVDAASFELLEVAAASDGVGVDGACF